MYLTTFALILLTLITIAILYWKHTTNYWKSLGIPYIKPSFPLGNLNSVFQKGPSMGFLTQNFYKEFKAHACPFGGLYAGPRPVLMLLDPELVKLVLVKDFDHFSSRGFYHCETNCLSYNLFTYEVHRWKSQRLKFGASFTSGKTRAMFVDLVACGQNLLEALNKLQGTAVDIKEVSACFTTDAICAVAYGLKTNSFAKSDGFRRHGMEFFRVGWWLQLKFFAAVCMPQVCKKLNMSITTQEIRKFFTEVVCEVVQYRKEKQLRREDFLQNLIDSEMDLWEIVRQAFIFFVGGFETSAKTIMFCLYELARNAEVQQRLREEISVVCGKCDGNVSYENLLEMDFLHQVVKETLRMYPPATTIDRECVKDYKIPNTEVVIEKGTKIIISTYGIQHDEDYFEDPDAFNPGREMPSFSYLPFGEGPRQCIGLRFGILEVKFAVATIVQEFKLQVHPRTGPLVFMENAFALSTESPVWLNVQKIGRGSDSLV